MYQTSLRFLIFKIFVLIKFLGWEVELGCLGLWADNLEEEGPKDLEEVIFNKKKNLRLWQSN